MKRNPCLTGFSFLLIASGIVLTLSSGIIYDLILGKLLDLTPGKVLYEEWIKPPPVMNFDVYFFNWTNPEDFSNKSKKPSFTEIGPFRFHVNMEWKNLTHNQNNDTISYERRKWYTFVRKESAHGLDHQVTILNQLSAVAAYKARNINYFIKKSMSVSLNSLSKIRLTQTAGELLFEGFADKILDLIRKLPIGVGDLPDKFGYFYGKNGSTDGIFNIGTGRSKYSLGTLYAWNGQNSTKYYGKSCRNISGASLDFYTDIKDKKVDIFNPELCRKLTLDYAGKSTVHGLEGQKFEIDDSFLDNGTIIPGNECFCADQCVPYGAVPAAACKRKANNYITLPHFFKADPFYADRIHGMKPNPKEHSFHIVVEPTTGFLLKLKARLQMNIYVEPISDISMFENAPTALFPIMWFQYNMKIPEDGAFSLGILLSLKGVFICIGIIFVILGILIYMLFVFDLTREKRFVNEEYAYSFTREMSPLNEKPGDRKLE